MTLAAAALLLLLQAFDPSHPVTPPDPPQMQSDKTFVMHVEDEMKTWGMADGDDAEFYASHEAGEIALVKADLAMAHIAPDDDSFYNDMAALRTDWDNLQVLNAQLHGQHYV